MTSKKRIVLLILPFMFSCVDDKTAVDNQVINSNELQENEGTTQFNVSVIGIGENESQLIIRSDTMEKGFVQLINDNYNEHHNGRFSRSPEYAQFEFFVEKSLSAQICKSHDFEKYNLTVYGNGGFDSLELKMHYVESEFDTSCFIFDTLNEIPMRQFSDPDKSRIIVEFVHPDFNLSPLDFTYYYTGIMMDNTHYFDTAYFCHFSTSDADSISVSGLYAKHVAMKGKVLTYRTDIDPRKD